MKLRRPLIKPTALHIPFTSKFGEEIYRGRLLRKFPRRYEQLHYPAMNYHPISEKPRKYLVVSGETLSGIIQRLLQDKRYQFRGSSFDQIMIAVFIHNPTCFFPQNINCLRAGTILVIPSDKQVASVSSEVASHTIGRHHREY